MAQLLKRLQWHNPTRFMQPHTLFQYFENLLCSDRNLNFYNVNAPRAGKDYQDHQSSSKISKAWNVSKLQVLRIPQYANISEFSGPLPKFFHVLASFENVSNHNPVCLFTARAQNGHALWLAGIDHWPLTICPLFFLFIAYCLWMWSRVELEKWIKLLNPWQTMKTKQQSILKLQPEFW